MKSVVLFAFLLSTAFAYNYEPESTPAPNDCVQCYVLMDYGLSALQGIVESGVVPSCAVLCSEAFNNTEYMAACDAICTIVGIEAFYKEFNATDLDPISVCQDFHICPVVTGGSANITTFSVNPTVVQFGNSAVFTMNYEVTQPVGPGLLVLYVIPAPPTITPIVTKKFFVGRDVQSYTQVFTLNIVPFEQEPFYNGVYLSYGYVCEGDCTDKHPNSRMLDRAQTKFTVQGEEN